ncbi:hypothetical protein VP01_13247g1, partial [Puccinia sorghi]
GKTISVLKRNQKTKRTHSTLPIPSWLISRGKWKNFQPLSSVQFLLNHLEEKQLKQEFRMTRGSFLHLCIKLLTNLIFHNKSPNPQRTMVEKMMVALKNLGIFGNAAFLGILVTFFQIGKETVRIYTNSPGIFSWHLHTSSFSELGHILS